MNYIAYCKSCKQHIIRDLAIEDEWIHLPCKECGYLELTYEPLTEFIGLKATASINDEYRLQATPDGLLISAYVEGSYPNPALLTWDHIIELRTQELMGRINNASGN